MELSFRNVGWPFHIGKVWEFHQYCVRQSASYSLVQWIFDVSLCQGDLFSLVFFSLPPDSFAMMMFAKLQFCLFRNSQSQMLFHIPLSMNCRFSYPAKMDISTFQSKLNLEKASQLDWKHFPGPSGHIPGRARARTVIWPTFLPLPIGRKWKSPPPRFLTKLPFDDDTLDANETGGGGLKNLHFLTTHFPIVEGNSFFHFCSFPATISTRKAHFPRHRMCSGTTTLAGNFSPWVCDVRLVYQQNDGEFFGGVGGNLC